jgi:3,5-epimerase/4-reductase
MVEPVLSNYANVLTLQLRMPVSDDLNPRNFVTKISKYEFVVNIPNSNSLLHDFILMAEKGDTGVYNFTNPGAISHNEVLDLYKKYIHCS